MLLTPSSFNIINFWFRDFKSNLINFFKKDLFLQNRIFLLRAHSDIQKKILLWLLAQLTEWIVHHNFISFWLTFSSTNFLLKLLKLAGSQCYKLLMALIRTAKPYINSSLSSDPLLHILIFWKSCNRIWT